MSQGQMGLWGPISVLSGVGVQMSHDSACQVLPFRSRLSPLTSFSLSQWLIRADCGLLFSLSFSELPTGFSFPSPRQGYRYTGRAKLKPHLSQARH